MTLVWQQVNKTSTYDRGRWSGTHSYIVYDDANASILIIDLINAAGAAGVQVFGAGTETTLGTYLRFVGQTFSLNLSLATARRLRLKTQRPRRRSGSLQLRLTSSLNCGMCIAKARRCHRQMRLKAIPTLPILVELRTTQAEIQSLQSGISCASVCAMS